MKPKKQSKTTKPETPQIDRGSAEKCDACKEPMRLIGSELEKDEFDPDASEGAQADWEADGEENFHRVERWQCTACGSVQEVVKI